MAGDGTTPIPAGLGSGSGAQPVAMAHGGSRGSGLVTTTGLLLGGGCSLAAVPAAASALLRSEPVPLLRQHGDQRHGDGPGSPTIPGGCGGLRVALAPRGVAQCSCPGFTRGPGDPHPGADPRLSGGGSPVALAPGERLVAHHRFSPIGTPRLAGVGQGGRGHQQRGRDGVSRGD